MSDEWGPGGGHGIVDRRVAGRTGTGLQFRAGQAPSGRSPLRGLAVEGLVAAQMLVDHNPRRGFRPGASLSRPGFQSGATSRQATAPHRLSLTNSQAVVSSP